MRLLLVLPLLVTICPGAPKVVFRGEAQELLDLSGDEQWALARGSRVVTCAKGKGKCPVPILAVYETATGKLAKEFVGEQSAAIYAARFFPGNQVHALVGNYISGKALLKWHFATGVSSLAPKPTESGDMPYCLLDDRSSLLNVNPLSLSRAGARTPHSDSYTEPTLWWNCRNWIRNGTLLARFDGRERKLWSLGVSGANPISCEPHQSFIHNFAISSDGQMMVVIRGEAGKPDNDTRVMSPEYKVSLEIRNLNGCELLRAFNIQFPELPSRQTPLLAPKNEYWANARLRNDFAKSLAISPDNRTVAIGYGVRSDGIYSDSVAYFGLFSIETGERLAVVKGDTFPNTLWKALFVYQDNVETTTAPLGPVLIFSRDGKTLFGSSERLYKWDVSALVAR